MDSVMIRPLEAGDEASWRRLWTDYLGFYETRVSEAVYRSSFDRLIAGTAGGAAGEFCGLVAVRGGRPIGLAHFLVHRHGWRIEDVCYLQDLFVESPMRGRGIARSLIEAVTEQAAAAGCSTVYWLSRADNRTARRLYDRVAILTPHVRYERSTKTGTQH